MTIKHARKLLKKTARRYKHQGIMAGDNGLPIVEAHCFGAVEALQAVRRLLKEATKTTK